MNSDEDGDGARMRTGTRVEANEGAQDGNEDGSGDGVGTGMGTGVETRGRTQNGNGDGSGDGVETGMGTRMETGMGTRTESGRSEERRTSARKHTSVVGAMWKTGETLGVERGKNVDKKGLVQ